MLALVSGTLWPSYLLLCLLAFIAVSTLHEALTDSYAGGSRWLPHNAHFSLSLTSAET